MTDIPTLDPELARLGQLLEQERHGRMEAEAVAKRGLQDLYERRRELTLIQGIVTAVNEAADIDAVMEFALRRICKYTGWPAGHVYLPDEDNPGELVSTDIWYTQPGESLDTLRRTAGSARFPPGKGLPGEVFVTGKAAWTTDLAGDGSIPPATPARQAGVSTAFDFPVLINAEVVAVLEFFSKQPGAPHESLLRIMTQVGTQLGRAIERKRAQDHLLHYALYDPLTNLPNRAMFTDCLNRLIAAARAFPTERQCFAVLFLDLDRFKTVNDSLGHLVGDELLVLVAQRLSACLRSADVVDRRNPHGDKVHVIGRLGGDEFTIILDGIHEPQDATHVAERIIGELGQPFWLSRHEVRITASVGIAFGNGASESGHDILREADIALYRAKARGRACWELFDETLGAQVAGQLKLEGDLHNALEKRELCVQYQPIVSLRDSEVHGFEALVRWRHPDKGWITPDEFIGLAEETGQIRAVGQWVLGEACSQVKRWRDAFNPKSPLFVSVNVSATEFAQRDFVKQVVATLRETGLDPKHLKLELTESAAMADPDRALQQLQELQSLGIHVSLDDFGTGYSSLSYLLRLPIHTLKIDRSFVSEIDVNDRKLRVLDTIITLARGLDIEVVAEGAETSGEVECLKTLNCRYAQGFYFSRALEHEAAEAMLSAQFAPETAARAAALPIETPDARQ